MDDIDDIIWQYNKERAYEALYDDEMCLVDSLSTQVEIGDCGSNKNTNFK